MCYVHLLDYLHRRALIQAFSVIQTVTLFTRSVTVKTKLNFKLGRRHHRNESETHFNKSMVLYWLVNLLTLN